MLFECHITVHFSDSLIAASIAEQNHWKTSEIARDPVLGDKPFYYLTKYDEDYVKLFSHLKMTVGDLQRAGARVLREKIELIMYDTKAQAPPP